ncbi:MAG: ribokinase [Hungatella sp.]|nr:ribokinase [Hungatella sp.]
MKVLVFGSLNIDYVYKVDHFARPGETLSSREMNRFCGGKGLNQSVAFGRSGAETYHAGAVGIHDWDMLTGRLKEAGVRTELIRKKEGPSGHAIIQTTPEGENSIILYRGANGRITREDVDFVLSHFQKGDILALQNEINQLPYIMERAKSLGMKIVMNPSPVDEEILKLPLASADYLILNEVEGEAISKVSSREEEGMLTELMRLFPDTRIVLTLGKNGSLYGYRNKICRQAACQAKAVDTTAAGDTFTGFFMGSIIRGKSEEEALEIASAAAAIAVGREGASSSIPDLKEVEAYGREKL